MAGAVSYSADVIAVMLGDRRSWRLYIVFSGQRLVLPESVVQQRNSSLQDWAAARG